ncbi:hypothetical protein T492DRAFT_918368, partial [Pavlovales sp. CCMP2436]
MSGSAAAGDDSAAPVNLDAGSSGEEDVLSRPRLGSIGTATPAAASGSREQSSQLPPQVTGFPSQLPSHLPQSQVMGFQEGFEFQLPLSPAFNAMFDHAGQQFSGGGVPSPSWLGGFADTRTPNEVLLAGSLAGPSRVAREVALSKPQRAWGAAPNTAKLAQMNADRSGAAVCAGLPPSEAQEARRALLNQQRALEKGKGEQAASKSAQAVVTQLHAKLCVAIYDALMVRAAAGKIL